MAMRYDPTSYLDSDYNFRGSTYTTTATSILTEESLRRIISELKNHIAKDLERGYHSDQIINCLGGRYRMLPNGVTIDAYPLIQQVLSEDPWRFMTSNSMYSGVGGAGTSSYGFYDYNNLAYVSPKPSKCNSCNENGHHETDEMGRCYKTLELRNEKIKKLFWDKAEKGLTVAEFKA